MVVAVPVNVSRMLPAAAVSSRTIPGMPVDTFITIEVVDSAPLVTATVDEPTSTPVVEAAKVDISWTLAEDDISIIAVDVSDINVVGIGSCCSPSPILSELTSIQVSSRLNSCRRPKEERSGSWLPMMLPRGTPRMVALEKSSKPRASVVFISRAF